MRDPQTPLSNRSCISTFRQHWHQAGWHKSQILFMHLIFPVINLALQPSAMLQALLPWRGVCEHLASLWRLSRHRKKRSYIKMTKSTPLPEGHASGLHNMLINVFKPQKDFHTLVSISGWGWLTRFSHESTACFQCTLQGLELHADNSAGPGKL